jgi:hypothetical protein
MARNKATEHEAATDVSLMSCKIEILHMFTLKVLSEILKFYQQDFKYQELGLIDAE